MTCLRLGPNDYSHMSNIQWQSRIIKIRCSASTDYLNHQHLDGSPMKYVGAGLQQRCHDGHAGLSPVHRSVRYSGALELQDSGLFGLFSWILSTPPSHKTFLLTGSSTSTLPPSSISSPHFSSLWVLVYWISGICFPGPVTVRRGISHWRTALIYTPLWLSPQKIKLSKKFPIHPPSTQHKHTHTHAHTPHLLFFPPSSVHAVYN